MKKRLLSAALALAMVLTLLPVTAFAATDYGSSVVNATNGVSNTPDAQSTLGKAFKYQEATSYDAYGDIDLIQGHWYWVSPAVNGTATVYEADSGFIVGKGNSGAWYPDESNYQIKTKATTLPNSFTLLTTQSFSLPMNTGVDVDLNGCDLTLGNLDDAGATSDKDITRITVTDSRHNRTGTLSLPASVDRSAHVPGKITGITLNATNVNVSGINFKGRANTVTLTNCAVGNITLNGQSFDARGAESWAAQNLTLTSSTLTGAIDIDGDRSSVKIQDSTVTSTVNVNSDGSNATNAVTVSGLSNVGAITVGNRAAKGTIPGVTVNGGTVNGIAAVPGASTTASSNFTINSTNGRINITGAISTDKGSVSITNATTSTIEVKAGSLTVGGSGNDIGTATLGATGATKLTINATGSTFDGFTTTGGNNLDITWPVGRVNNYGTLNLGSYNKGQIKGGVFSSATGTALGNAANMGWVDSANLQFIVPIKGSTDVALYGRTELTEAISSIADTTAATTAQAITVLGQGTTTPAQYIQLNWGYNPWVYIRYDAKTGIYLPTRINNTGVSTWIIDNSTLGLAEGTRYTAGVEQGLPVPTSGNLVLSATDTTAAATSITNARISTTTPGTDNANVRVRLNGNNIELSGAVEATAGGYATIVVDLITDVVDKDGNPVVISGVGIDYNVNTKAVSFDSASLSLTANGAIVDASGALVLNRGTGARYTVTANLAVSASSLDVYTLTNDCAIVVTVGGKLSSWSATAKNDLIKTMQENGSFSFSGNKAMLEAINAAQATITNNSTIDTWVANAKQNIWKNGYSKPDGTSVVGKHTGNFKDFLSTADAATINTYFKAAYIVPYLVVNVTDYTADGTLTATLTPYYRVDLSDASYDSDYAYTLQAGKTLGVLSGDMMSNPVTVNLGIAGLGSKMHQDGKYVYDGANNWRITHANPSGGLGTVVVNNTDGLISMTSTITDRWGTGVSTCPWTYDSLQAAVDDTIPGATVANNPGAETLDTITVDGNYKGDCNFTMSGYARKIRVTALGDLPIKCTSKDVDTQNPSGYTYTFQLKRDTAPTGGNITISSATGGSASVNHNPASTGQTVTITLSPNAGYSSSGVSVKDSSGKAVSVSGSGNTYTFTMPAGTVTVTPSFTSTGTTPRKATVSVSPNSMGTTTTTAAATNNQVDSGSSVGVTTAPASGYRTMGVNISTNGGATTAVRQGDNYFTFTVPANATAVTVTPIYDRDNGTKFSDVWSTEYYSKSVAWAVGRGVTDGTSTYAFSPSNTCTRAQMMTFLWRAAGRPSVAGISNPFVDVSPTLTPGDYYSAILWAVSKGITNGTDATHFSPSRTVSRAQAVTFLYRYAGSPTASTNTGFYDTPSSEYYARAVSWASAKGITNGTSTNYFSPSQGVSRAQAVTFLYRHITGDIA